MGFRTSIFGSQDLGFKTSIIEHSASLLGLGFQDLDKRTLGFTLRTQVSGPRHRKLSILRSSYLFLVIFLCVHRHFSFSCHFSLRPVVSYLCGRFCHKKCSQNIIGHTHTRTNNTINKVDNEKFSCTFQNVFA